MARILIAEDEAPLRGQIARALAVYGHETATAADGGEALEQLLAEKSRFDLLLTDIKMPVMDGIALALAAARDFPELAIVLMTGFAEQRERAHTLRSLITEVLGKPFSLAELHSAVARALAVGGNT